VVHGVLVRRPGGASVARRRGDLSPETQQSEEEEPNPVRALAQLRRLGLGLMTVSHANPAWSRVPHSPAHAPNPTGTGPACERQAGLSGTRGCPSVEMHNDANREQTYEGHS
jgi:hypothetical protein